MFVSERVLRRAIDRRRRPHFLRESQLLPGFVSRILLVIEIVLNTFNCSKFNTWQKSTLIHTALNFILYKDVSTLLSLLRVCLV